ncbi:MAG: hypothetical protein LW806_01740 [Planctomycetaceae bacterium]|nr:hypothetical protein [Planctomycetaceae bacterium]
MIRPAPALLALIGAFLLVCLAPRSAQADNAGFALAPKNATFAFDARELSTLLGRENASGVRPIIEALAGRDALMTFDALARRCNAAGDIVAQEVFSGRVAFSLIDVTGNPSWIFGIEADDDRCARVLAMLGAKMRAPGIFDAPTEQLTIRRVGGWLLVSPSRGGEEALDAASRRIAVEDAESSLLGEPLAQQLLVSDAPVRIFVRHDPPIGGATTIGVRARDDGKDARGGLRAEIDGQYDDPPLGEANVVGVLDGALIRALEERAVFAVSSPANGRPGTSDAFWLALVPELRPTPTMRANLAGERLVLFGASSDRVAPALAVAWRVDDAVQAKHDQDQHMRGVLCGLARGVEAEADAGASKVDHGKPDDGAADVGRITAVTAPAVRTSPLIGPFLDRYLGRSFKLGEAVLCWETVTTPCGGWQLYASDPAWMADVSRELVKSSCTENGKRKVGGLGFCDGPRAAAVLRRWRPLAGDAPDDRVGRGIDALAATVEELGRMRFSYTAPGVGRLQATVELEPLGRLAAERRAATRAPDGPAAGGAR